MSERRHRAKRAGGLECSPPLHLSLEGAFKHRKAGVGSRVGMRKRRKGGQKSRGREKSKRERWIVDPRMPLVPSLLSGPQGPRLQDPHQETGLSRKGLHSIGQVGEGSQDEEERQFLALPQALGVGTDFWHCLQGLPGN